MHCLYLHIHIRTNRLIDRQTDTEYLTERQHVFKKELILGQLILGQPIFSTNYTVGGNKETDQLVASVTWSHCISPWRPVTIATRAHVTKADPAMMTLPWKQRHTNMWQIAFVTITLLYFVTLNINVTGCQFSSMICIFNCTGNTFLSHISEE